MKAALTGLVRAGITLAVVTALGRFAACSDNPTGLCSSCSTPPQGLMVSNPVSATGLAAGAAPARANTDTWIHIPSDGPVRDYVSVANLGGPQEHILLYGGVTYDPNGGQIHMGDTWELDLARGGEGYVAQWQLMAPTSSPGPRASHGLIGTEAMRAVLYGGGNDQGTLGDTWVYRSRPHSGWQPRSRPH